MKKTKNFPFSPFCETNFYAEKNPTSTFKFGGFCDPKMFFNFPETSLIISKKTKICSIKIAKTIFIRKKIQLQIFFRKLGVLWFCWKFAQMNFRWNKFAPIWKKILKNFESEENPTSTFKIGGFCRQKMFSNFPENLVKWTSDGINLPLFRKSWKTFLCGK